jgi:hypothetical protein
MKKLLLILSLMLPLLAQVEGDIQIPYVDFTMKKGEGVYTTRGMCNMCHSFGYVINQGRQSREFWMEKTIKMIKVFNAPINPKDVEIVVDYLYENYGEEQENNTTKN